MASVAAYNLIVPSSVTSTGGSVSLSASGKITWSACPRIYVDGVFSTTYRYYVIVAQGISSSNHPVSLRWRASSTDLTSSVYQRIEFYASGSTISSLQQTNNDIAYWSTWNTAETNGLVAYVNSPAHSQYTSFLAHGLRTSSGAYANNEAGIYNATTAIDGFFWGNNSDTTTGTMTIYGLTA